MMWRPSEHFAVGRTMGLEREWRLARLLVRSAARTFVSRTMAKPTSKIASISASACVATVR